MPSLLSKFTKNAASNAAQPELDRSPAHRRTRVNTEHSPPRSLIDESLPLPPLNGGPADSLGLLLPPQTERERRTSSPARNQVPPSISIHPPTLDRVNNSPPESAGITSNSSTQSRTSPAYSADSAATAVEYSAGMSLDKHRQSASDSSYMPLFGSPPQYDNLLNAAIASSSSSSSPSSSLAPLASPSMPAGAGAGSSTRTATTLTPSPTTPPSQKQSSSWRRRESSASFRAKQAPHRRIHPSGGLASAIAGTGLSLANTAMQRPIVMVPPPPSTNNSNVYRTDSLNSNGRDRHSQSRRSSASAGASNGTQDSAVPYRSMTFDTISTSKDDDSFGDSDEEDDEEEETSQDELDPLANGVAPITGFAVASNKRTADFHTLFPTVPEGDYLIDDYGCALQREILIQGRLYISENHLCFHANIFGWTTDLVIPIEDILQIEKKMTAYVIPNAIQVTTYTSKHTFASLLNRDTTYDVLYNIWRSLRPEGTGSPRGSIDINRVGTNSMGSVIEGMESVIERIESVSADISKIPAENKTTTCACGKAGEHYPELAMEAVVPCEPEKIYNLMFASGFIKDFMRQEKLADIQISDWTPKTSGSNLLQRNMSYIKPLTGSIGPKQTKCELTDEMVHLDYNDYISMLTTTRTPDVPSGGVFSVKTRTCLMWASRTSTRIVVTTAVEWTGRSFIKGIIERSCIDGQKTYHAILERSMRRYIAENKAEFFPNGLDAESALGDALVSTEDTAPSPPLLPSLSSEDIRKAKEKERSQRSLQWAWDTAEGAAKVGHQSFWGAIELIKDAWESSSTTTVLWFVVVGLLLSNLWTFYRANRKATQSARRYKDGSYPYPYPPYAPLREDDVQRAVGESVRDAIRMMMIEDAVRVGGAAGAGAGAGGSSSSDSPKTGVAWGAGTDLGDEMAGLKRKIEGMEERLFKLELDILQAQMSSAFSSVEELD